MIDFLMISTRSTKRGVIEIYPKFIIKKSTDLMIRGGDFYAIWIEERGLWSTDENDALQLIDHELKKYAEENKHKFEANIKILYMWDAESGMIDTWHKYCQRQLRDSFNMLDEHLVFSNTTTNKKDYASKRLNYPLEKGEISSFDKLISTLYNEEERCKIEWAIGSIVSGDSKTIQKFMVLYGSAGTGKSTILNIIQQLFEGYYSVFDAKALGSASNSFALESFKTNPLVAIQHDGDLSKIEDNTRLNSLVSHELMTVNEKFKSTYSNRFKSFLFMGTNKPVKITDAKSGLIRRLIDVSPSGNKVSQKEYDVLIKNIKFELGAIAYHCKEVYLSNHNVYDDYIPTTMLGASNDFYNFILDSFHIFKKDDGVSLKVAWEMYKTYCDEAKVGFPFSQRVFKEEIKNYFYEYKERFQTTDGSRVRSYYSGFKVEKFEEGPKKLSTKDELLDLIDFGEKVSIFDKDRSNCLAQYATSNETPIQKWDNVRTKLENIDTSKLHYVKVPENHIVIDFDITDEMGEKSYDKNLNEASKWPKTYAELSKSGKGIHLHYIYNGDVNKLSRIYGEHIEVKVYTGKSSLRRKLTKCNNLQIANINSGLPLKEVTKMLNLDNVKNEKAIRTLVIKNINKEIHSATKPSIDFIHKILEEAYASDVKYDISDMRNSILAFAVSSSNQADYCIKLVNKMQFKSADISINSDATESKLIFYDIEVFPNLFLVNWKVEGDDKPVVRMINPTSSEIEELMKFRLVGFNCRRYDNHILYARLMGYTNEQIYNLSQKIINGSPNCFFGEAYNISYTDVYDFSSKKQSLKKFEIELGLHHQELGLPWDEPVSEDMWVKVAEYCDNDVLATEATFNARKSDFLARQILADIAGMTVNDTTNTLSTRIIFGKNRKPHDQFNYRSMGEISEDCGYFSIEEGSFLYSNADDGFTVFDEYNRPIFPGYKFECGKSTYRGEEVGEGGYVYSEPGMYSNVALLDVASMHPSSIVAEDLFGEEYTARFKDILDARMAIKHGDFDKARNMLNGVLAKYLDDESVAGDLAQALKIAINSVYGLTSARFDNPFRDKRNVDNIVAKRGALFMINLKYAVQQKGFTVAHVKTDSIKIPNATPEIIKFVSDYGKEYGYDFEHEATYDRMCLVNDAVYIARYKDGKKTGKWTATGTQFAVPYVFKKLFSKEEISFEDMCETKNVVQGRLFLDMNEGYPDVSEYQKEYDLGVKLLKKGGLSPTDIKEIEDGLEYVKSEIDKGHNYIFIGKVGRFCPVKDEAGGGVLYREKDGKYYAVTGTKGYRWLESEMVEKLNKQNYIDRTYYDKLVDDAIEDISKYGDMEWFVSNDNVQKHKTPCDIDQKECYDCRYLNQESCELNFDISQLQKCSLLKPDDRDCVGCENLYKDGETEECKLELTVSELPF
ncbi:MAG: DUF5906 domain-containing protein [Clostridia bacterium]